MVSSGDQDNVAIQVSELVPVGVIVFFTPHAVEKCAANLVALGAKGQVVPGFVVCPISNHFRDGDDKPWNQGGENMEQKEELRR